MNKDLILEIIRVSQEVVALTEKNSSNKTQYIVKISDEYVNKYGKEGCKEINKRLNIISIGTYGITTLRDKAGTFIMFPDKNKLKRNLVTGADKSICPDELYKIMEFGKHYIAINSDICVVKHGSIQMCSPSTAAELFGSDE